MTGKPVLLRASEKGVLLDKGRGNGLEGEFLVEMER
jgi:hypothetical protein